jgi:hypothetical protein
MNYIAFAPKYHIVPDELISVLISPGLVTRAIWEEALALRIESLVLAQESPDKASIEACQFLGCELTDDPHDLPEKIFHSNTLLQAQLKVCGIGDEHFPVYVVENDENALQILENDSLEMWVAYASSFVEANKEALLAYTSGNWFERQQFENIKPHIIDVEIRPYADFIKRNIDVYFDYECYDADSFKVYLKSYDFNFTISHHHGCVMFSAILTLNRKKNKEEIKRVEKNVSEFNRAHTSKVTFPLVEKKSFFLKKIYILNWCFFEMEFPLGSSKHEIQKTFATFFGDFQGLLTNEDFFLPIPDCLNNNKQSFLEYLGDLVGRLKIS